LDLLANFPLTNYPDNIPYDAIVTILIFLVGIPALVLQFMAPDVRRVTIKRIVLPKEVLKRLLFAISVVAVFIVLAWRYPNYKELFITGMLSVLIMVVGFTTLQVQYRFGWRESIILDLKEKTLSRLNSNDRMNEDALELILEIGKQSEAGSDREVVLNSIHDIVSETCSHASYKGDSLGSLVEGLVKILINQPALEDTQNYQLAVSILIRVLSAPNADTLIDQQHAVRALSALGQTLLAEIAVTVGTNHILMDYEEALGLAVARHPSMQTDVTQSLLEVGSVAIDHKHYLFAVASCERLLTIIEENESLNEALADLLGLTAHFWADGKSSKEFVKIRLERVYDCVDRAGFSSLDKAIQYAIMHSMITMRFDTADKLAQMAEDLKSKPKPRKKK